MAETHVHETTAERRSSPMFSLDNALNTPGFADHLAKYRDAEKLEFDDANAEEIEQRYNTFRFFGETSKRMKQLYKETILNETGIQLEDAELAPIDTYLENRAIEAPKEIKMMLDQVREFSELPGRKERSSRWVR